MHNDLVGLATQQNALNASTLNSTRSFEQFFANASPAFLVTSEPINGDLEMLEYGSLGVNLILNPTLDFKA